MRLERENNICLCDARRADSQNYTSKHHTHKRPVFEQQTQNNNWELIEKLVSIPHLDEKCNFCVSCDGDFYIAQASDSIKAI
jgi:hypothetical protein